MLSEDPEKRKVSDAATESVGSHQGHPGLPAGSIKGFRIKSTLGAGGMGAVYQAYDETMKRTVALKVLHPSLEFSDQTVSRFAREAWIAGQLDHECIIRVYSRSDEGPHRYIAMELADGGSLADHIAEVRLSLPDGSDVTDTVRGHYVTSVLKKFAGLARSLEYIHSKGFIHRDIKPHNILICGDEKQFKFNDFGIAHAPDMTKITRAGDFIGTVKYMSPELLAASRAKVDHRADVYSLGVTLYETLTLTLPYRGDSNEQYMSEILAGHSIPARKCNKRLSRDIETVLLKAMHHDPDMRYQTSGEMAEDIERVLESRPIRAKREGILSRFHKFLRRHAVTVTAVSATAVLVALLLWWYVGLQQTANDEVNLKAILNTVLDTGKSPFEIDPDWDRLSDIAFDKLERDPNGDVARLLFQCMCLLDFKVLEHCLYETGQFWAEGKEIRGITDIAYERWRAGTLRGVLKKTKYFVALDGGEFVPVGVGAGVMYKTGFGFDFYLKDVTDSVPEGIHHLRLVWNTDCYTNAGLKFLFEEEWSDLGRGFYIHQEEPADSIYDLTSGNPSESYFSFSNQKEFNIWIHDEFPEDFPKAVLDSSLTDLYKSKIVIEEVDVVRVPPNLYSRSRYRVQLRGAVDADIPHPIAARFRVDLDTREQPILTGQILVYKNHFVFFDLKAERYREQAGWVHRDQDVFLAITDDEGFTVEIDSLTFDSLTILDQHSGVLTIVPSRRIAFEAGHYFEFWDDVMEMPIVVKCYERDEDFF